MFLPMNLLFEYWIKHVTLGLLCPYGVWCRVLTTCLLYVDPLYGNLIWNDYGFVGLAYWRTTFTVMLITCAYMPLHIFQCLITIWDLTFIYISFTAQMLYFLQSTPVLPFYKDAVFMIYILTNDDPFPWSIYVSPTVDELMHIMEYCIFCD